LGGGVTLTANPTYRELISSGGLRLIESGALRAALVTHYGAVEELTERISQRVGGYPLLMHEYYPAERRGLESEAAVRAFGLERAVEGIRSERFVRVMNQEFNLLYFMRPNVERVLQMTSEVLVEVDAQLGR
jgi:hypothetical protein